MTLLQQIAVPAQDRVRPYQQQKATQFLHGQMVQQAGQQKPVIRGEGGLRRLALQDGQLVP